MVHKERCPFELHVEKYFGLTAQEATERTNINTDFGQMVCLLASFNPWISVEDRLPEIHENVLVSISNGWHTLIGKRWNNSWTCYFADGEQKETRITHWRSLPSPPLQNNDKK